MGREIISLKRRNKYKQGRPSSLNWNILKITLIDKKHSFITFLTQLAIFGFY